MHSCKCRCELVHDTVIEQWVDKITKLIVDLVIMIVNVNLHFCFHHLAFYINLYLVHDGGIDICVIEILRPADSTRKFSVA